MCIKKKEKDEIKQKYPKFISNNPCGSDKFEGRSQERLVQAIATHITSNESNKDDNNPDTGLSKIIGLEGGWGVGKSNVIRQLKNAPHIKDEYYIFEYDAWGHQEDLQRRSFLETLTGKLSKKNILKDKNKDWTDCLTKHLAQKTYRESETTPKFDSASTWIIILVALTPLFYFIANLLKEKSIIDNLVLVSIIAFLPILISIAIFICVGSRNKDKFNLGWVLQISQRKAPIIKTTEILHQKEPNVVKFKEWMKIISNNLNGKKLIIVYDNMDRLPAEKVKQLWSSIHTFFSDQSYENVWTIIPFDREHLANAFNDGEIVINNKNINDNKTLTDYFISKTFPIVYRVPMPVMTDVQSFLNELLKEAFRDIENNQFDIINRAFRLVKPKATARVMIEFINQLVALRNIWHDEHEIKLEHIAIYLLVKRDLLAHDTDDSILSFKFLDDNLKKLIIQDDTLQRNIAALAYGVPLEKAQQLPLRNYINFCFLSSNKKEASLNKYADMSVFFRVLQDTIYNADYAITENIIHSLEELNLSSFPNDNNEIKELWNLLTDRLSVEEVAEQKLKESHKFILKHSDEKFKIKLIKRLCNGVQNFTKDKFSGKEYFKFFDELKDLIEEYNIPFKMHDNLKELNVTPNIFIDYVNESKEKYPLYKLKVSTSDFNSFLSTLKFENYAWHSTSDTKGKPNNFSHSYIVNTIKSLLKVEDYQFESLQKNIEESLHEVDYGFVWAYLDIYKLISKEKPLNIKPSETQINDILAMLKNSNDVFKENIEILVPFILSDIRYQSSFEIINISDDAVDKIANHIEYYETLNTLLERATNTTPLLNKVLRYMIENNIGDNVSIIDVLTKYKVLINQLEISEATLLQYLNKWANDKSYIKIDNLQVLFPDPSIYEYTLEVKNELTNHINEITFTKLSELELYQLKIDFATESNYWPQVFKIFHKAEYIIQLPENMNELAKEYLKDIASSNMDAPTTDSINHTIINMVRNPHSTIDEIINNICNGVSGYNITSSKFLYLHKFLEEYGRLGERKSNIPHFLLEPIIDNEECLNEIIEQKELYAHIINEARERADSFKNKYQTILNSSTEDKVIDFGKDIGLQVEKDKRK